MPPQNILAITEKHNPIKIEDIEAVIDEYIELLVNECTTFFKKYDITIIDYLEKLLNDKEFEPNIYKSNEIGTSKIFTLFREKLKKKTG
jgi:hypothetical protein